MKALVLAAGYGTRMDPSGTKPKHLLEIKENTPVIELAIENLITPEIKEIYILTNNKFYDQFEAWLSKSKLNRHTDKKIILLNNRTNNNEERLGSVGDIIYGFNKINYLGPEKEGLIVAQGDDLIYSLSINNFLNKFYEKKATLVITHRIPVTELAKRFGVVNTNVHNQIIQVQEKPELHEIITSDGTALANGGLYAFTKENLDDLMRYKEEKIGDEQKPLDGTGRLFAWMAEQKIPFFSYEYPKENWWDVGNSKTLEEARKFYQLLTI